MGFMFFDLHVSLKKPFVRGYKFVEFVLLVYLLVGSLFKLAIQNLVILKICQFGLV